jgi:hypothetical protein
MLQPAYSISVEKYRDLYVLANQAITEALLDHETRQYAPVFQSLNFTCNPKLRPNY